MKYQRTQVYLDPQDHRALVEEAERRGISLAALMREIVSRHTARGGAPAPEKTFDHLIGVVTCGPSSDIARHEDRYKREAAERRSARKLSGSSRPASSKGQRRG